MTRSARLFIVIGCLSLLTATQLSALGFHALQLAPDDRAAWGWANQLQFYQSLGLVLLGIVMGRLGDSWLLTASGTLLTLGLLLFSGSIYLDSTGLAPGAGAVAPLGGGSFMLAWLLAGIAAFRARG